MFVIVAHCEAECVAVVKQRQALVQKTDLLTERQDLHNDVKVACASVTVLANCITERRLRVLRNLYHRLRNHSA